MGKGDKKSKIFKGSYVVTRPHKVKKAIAAPAAKLQRKKLRKNQHKTKPLASDLDRYLGLFCTLNLREDSTSCALLPLGL